MNTETTGKQYGIRLSGSNIFSGIHYLNVYGAISQIFEDVPPIRRFKNREEAQNWVDKYKNRPFSSFKNISIIEL